MNLTLHHAHPWKLDPEAAVTLQRRLAQLVKEEPWPRPPQTVGGVDMSGRGDQVQAVVVVLQMPELTPVDQATWQGGVEFPYIPGLLSFREVPAVLRALEQLTTALTLACTTRYRIPEPTRHAHRLSKQTGENRWHDNYTAVELRAGVLAGMETPALNQSEV